MRRAAPGCKGARRAVSACDGGASDALDLPALLDDRVGQVVEAGVPELVDVQGGLVGRQGLAACRRAAR